MTVEESLTPAQIELTLRRTRDARTKWSAAQREFTRNYDNVLKRLLLEAASNRLSAEWVAERANITPKRARALLREAGADPRKAKTLLADAAAKALAHNAELLGIKPMDIDLLSPLAYLPGGASLEPAKRSLPTAGVTDLDEDAL